MNENELNRNPIFKIGVRSVLLLGCDRTLLIISAVLLIITAYALRSVLACFICGGLMFVVIGLLRKLAKADPYMYSVYMNQRKYNHVKFYHTHATHFGTSVEKYK